MAGDFYLANDHIIWASVIVKLLVPLFHHASLTFIIPLQIDRNQQHRRHIEQEHAISVIITDFIIFPLNRTSIPLKA
jgi:Na+/H+ antiporter NhaA